MKKFIYTLLTLTFLSSCSTPGDRTNVCLSGDCDAYFWISSTGHPGTYQDTEGIWHIKHAGLNYFTVLGEVSKLDPHYVINLIPLVTTAYDSNFFYLSGDIVWTYPVYSYLGLWSSQQMNTPIAIGTQTYTFPELSLQNDIKNLAGYTILENPNPNYNHPAYQTYFSTYSRYTYTPQQSMVFFEDFIGMSATIYINVTFGENKQEVLKELKVIFEP